MVAETASTSPACDVTVGVLPVVGAGFRIEWRFDVLDARAESREHVLEHRVALDQHVVGRELRGHVAIGQVIDRTQQRQWRRRR